MNARPHIHDVVIRQYAATGHWIVEYGDTHVWICNRWGNPYREPRLTRKVKKAVSRHDEGSITAGQEAEIRRQKQEEIRQMMYKFRVEQGKWGSEQLDERLADTWGHNG